jgi:putative membrane protein
MDRWTMMAGFGWLGIIMMALFCLGMIALVVWGVRHLAAPRHPLTASDALEIVKQRYARGEIDREEFERMRETLRSPHGGTP